MSEPALFVGGPWDGVMQMMDAPHPTYMVAVHNSLAFPPRLRAGSPDVVNEIVTNAEYQRLSMCGRVFYLIKLYGYEERANRLDPHERLVEALARGYRRQ